MQETLERRHVFNFWIRKIPWRRKWQPTPVFLPGKSYGQRSKAGGAVYKGHKELNMTEQLSFTTDTLRSALYIPEVFFWGYIFMSLLLKAVRPNKMMLCFKEKKVQVLVTNKVNDEERKIVPKIIWFP